MGCSYVSAANTEPYVLSSMLYIFIFLLKNLIQEDANKVQFSFAGLDDSVVLYNNILYIDLEWLSYASCK